MRLDLHVHSTASDGAYAPAEVVQLALGHQLEVIALTDHDTLAGLPAAREAAGSRLQVLTGVELSAEDEHADRHILGYLVNEHHDELNALLVELKEARRQRVERIVAKLNSLSVGLTVDEVLALANGAAVGRPHVARALLRAGYVTSLQEAFNKYIGDNGPAYEPHYRLAPARAVQMIHRAGGVAVLAHPGRYKDYRPIVDELLAFGLDGIEVYYPDHSPDMVKALRALAHQHNLIITGGSDFHRREFDGSARIGSVKIPPEVNVLEALHERARR